MLYQICPVHTGGLRGPQALRRGFNRWQTATTAQDLVLGAHHRLLNERAHEDTAVLLHTLWPAAPAWANSPALLVVGALLAAALTYALSVVVMRVCVRHGWLDRPSPRRVHTRPVPRLGGIAIFVAFLAVSCVLYWPRDAYEAYVYIGLLLAAVVIVAVMAWDDLRGLPVGLRLGVQTLAALIAMFPGAHGTLIEVLHNPLAFSAGHSHIVLGLWVAVPFTWFWLVGMMNTVNWMDGTDGLAA